MSPGGRRILSVCAVAVLLAVLLAREGLFGPALAFDLGGYAAERQVDARAEHVVHAPRQDAPSEGTSGASLAGTFLTCRVRCEPRSDVCESIERWLQCDADVREPGAGTRRTTAEVTVRGSDDPFCYVPFVKEGRVRPEVTVELSTGGGTSQVRHTLKVEPAARVKLTGLASCRVLRERLGHAVAEIVADHMRQVIAAN